MYPSAKASSSLIDMCRHAMSRPLIRYAVWGIVLLVLLLFTHINILTPFKFSYVTARKLVESEAELARIKNMTQEYRAAAKYADTPEGKEFARKMMFGQPNPDENIMKITPAPSDANKISTGKQLRHWVETEKTQLAETIRYNFRIIHRWFCDPPQKPAKT